MNHQHRALSDEGIIEQAKWHYASGPDSPMVELIRRLSGKPYAPLVAAFWVMDFFHIAGPMGWTGEMFEGEATEFVTVSLFDGAIRVSFRSELEDSPDSVGGIDESERLIDAYVSRLLSTPAREA